MAEIEFHGADSTDEGVKSDDDDSPQERESLDDEPADLLPFSKSPKLAKLRRKVSTSRDLLAAVSIRSMFFLTRLRRCTWSSFIAPAVV